MHMRKPKVSVIITTKKEEKYIEQCLKSLQNQTFKDFEIIVTDSNSRDKTVNIAKKYTKKIIVKKMNVAAGRNVGASAASGKILVFVDADTILMPDTLEKTLDAFKNSKVVGASCPALPLTADPKYLFFYMIYNRYAKTSVRLKKGQIAGFFCAYRKDAFNKVGGFDEHIGVFEDFDLSRRISRLGQIKFTEDTMVLTSHRRLRGWGMNKFSQRAMKVWLNYIVRGRGFSYKWYNPIR